MIERFFSVFFSAPVRNAVDKINFFGIFYVRFIHSFFCFMMYNISQEVVLEVITEATGMWNIKNNEEYKKYR